MNIPFSIESKLGEECSELAQVACKAAQVGGLDQQHWDGDLRPKAEEEIGDVLAGMEFIINKYKLSRWNIDERRMAKLTLYQQWSKERSDTPAAGANAEQCPPRLMIDMVDSAMFSMRDLVPPLTRGDCERLIRAALFGVHAPHGPLHSVEAACVCRGCGKAVGDYHGEGCPVYATQNTMEVQVVLRSDT
jgi:NTP pyrophosphatase (non-canonical NTP hydrolase)